MEGSLPGRGFGVVDRRYQCDGCSDCQHDNGPPQRTLADADVTKRAYQRHNKKTPIKPVLHQPDSQVSAKHRDDGYPSPREPWSHPTVARNADERETRPTFREQVETQVGGEPDGQPQSDPAKWGFRMTDATPTTMRGSSGPWVTIDR